MKTTEEKNRMIAEFMEYPGDGNGRYFRPTSEALVYADSLPYHTSWEWLMEVVEKIERLGYTVNISRITTSIGEIGNEETMFSWVCGDVSKKLEITYNAVVQFIEWYNEQK